MPLTRVAAVCKGALMAYLAPKLAMDARIDLHPLLNGLTAKNFASKRNELLGGVTNLVKDKLAKDAELDHLPELLEALEKEEDGGMDEEEDDKEKKVEEDADPNAAPPSSSHEFLKGKLSSEDMATYDALSKDEVKPGVDPNAREKEQGIDAEEDDEEEEMKKKKAEDDRGDLITKSAMDSAITSAIGSEKQRQQAIRAAEKAFRPHLGELTMSFDSAEEVYRHGLKALGVKTKLDNVPLPALQAILESQPAKSVRREDHQEVAMDSAAVSAFQSRFKGAVQPKQL